MYQRVRGPLARASFAVLLALASWALLGAGEPTPLIGQMPCAMIEVGNDTYRVRVARTARHRSAGFQYVAGSQMRGEAIQFVYPSPSRPSFHMRNVERPLMLAWIAPDGRVRDVIRMPPNASGHRAPAPVARVLEFPEGHPLERAVRPGVRIRQVASDVRCGDNTRERRRRKDRSRE